MSTTQVSNPVDKTELSYAIEELAIEALENGMEQEEIADVLERYSRAAKKNDIEMWR